MPFALPSLTVRFSESAFAPFSSVISAFSGSCLSSAVRALAVGAGAANQAIKAVAIARGYLAPLGINMICIPAFANVVIDGEERTAIKLICEER